MPEKVLVAMSGGVDSAVAAMLLHRQGYEVCGATMKLFDNEKLGIEEESTCCSLRDVEDARRVCFRMGLDHYVFGFGRQFEADVMDRFADGYRRGETPNPCIDCNRFVKFPLLLERAASLGAGRIATGHYARVARDPGSGRWLLLRGRSRDKDQSYVLYAMTQDQLARTLFPLGELAKDEVRRLAEAEGMAVADKPDSQDICFVPDGDYAAFLSDVMRVESRSGALVDREGAVLGRHDGIHRFTLGQRRGLPIRAAGRRVYVTAIDPGSGRVTVGEDRDLYRGEFAAGALNWISIESLTAPLEVGVQTRYRQREAPAILYPLADGRVRVLLREPQRAITPGQAAVFYDGDVVVGGGTVLREDCDEFMP